MKDNESLPVTFNAKIVVYPVEKGWTMTLHETRKLLESGKYEIEFIMPFNLEPTIIIKPILTK